MVCPIWETIWGTYLGSNLVGTIWELIWEPILGDPSWSQSVVPHLGVIWEPIGGDPIWVPQNLSQLGFPRLAPHLDVPICGANLVRHHMGAKMENPNIYI